MDAHGELRRLPSVDVALGWPEIAQHVSAYGREAVVQAIRQALADARAGILGGATYGGDAGLVQAVGAVLSDAFEPTLVEAINATGVVLHTNLGRAPLSEAVLAAMARVGGGYSNLEFDLSSGRRGSRYVHAEDLLCRLTGAEAALLVNNNAGAVLLTLSALVAGHEVVISRGQLVEIGGGFRIPDVMAQSGARLVEVGTTNRTRIGDYDAAIVQETAALMRVHASNFYVVGFTEQPSLSEIVTLAHGRGMLVFDDLGSGTLIDTEPLGLRHEPTVQESVAAGVDVVTFSGDKLLGGPQAGIILGRTELIAHLRRHPLTRALRVDKTTIAGIQANLLHYLKGEALEQIPIWRMMAAPAAEIRARAARLLEELGAAARGCELVEGESAIGGGSLPAEVLPTWLIALPGGSADTLARALREGRPAVVSRIVDGRVVLDLRTVLESEEAGLVARLRQALDV